MPIRIDCYLSVMDRYTISTPGHYEIVAAFVGSRPTNSPLAPSGKLLRAWKNHRISWETYETVFLQEMTKSIKAQKRMRELKELAKTQNVFLVCYEKDVQFCHRRLLKEMIEKV